jgi:heat-inducible transcriptional repressor
VSISQVALLAVKPGKLLVVTVLSTGHIDHRTLEYSGSLSHADVISLGNFINARCHGTDLQTFSTRADEELPMELRLLDRVYKKAITAVKQALASATDDELFMEGTGQMLKQPEFSPAEKAGLILEALEHQSVLYQMLTSALLGGSVTVVIGTENGLQKMQEFSFVATSYSIGGRACGSVGVIGPTRMDYRRAVAAVNLMASNLSDLLTSLSLE